MTTAYYTRVSIDTQDPDRQVEEIRDHLGEATFRDARAYADIASGTKDNREEFQQLWQDTGCHRIVHKVVDFKTAGNELPAQ